MRTNRATFGGQLLVVMAALAGCGTDKPLISAGVESAVAGPGAVAAAADRARPSTTTAPTRPGNVVRPPVVRPVHFGVDAGPPAAVDAGQVTPPEATEPDAGQAPAPVEVDAGQAPAPAEVDAGQAPAPGEIDAGEATPPVDVDAGPAAPPEPDAGPPPAEVVDAGSEPAPVELDAGAPEAVDAGAPPTSTPANPSFGCWAWSTPDVTAVARAGFQWFESGYPGTLSAADNDYLVQHGIVPFAYINMAEVPNDDSYLQGQIGTFWPSIALCSNGGWNTTVVDVRDARWQDWLVRRANAAYALGNRGIKWDVAEVESLCNGWPGNASAPQQAIDAMASVLATLKAQHPDFKFIVNQGFGLAEQHPELVDGFELENMVNYYNQNPGDSWSAEYIARVGSIHTNGHIPILNLEYYDLFGCSDTTCSYADQLYNQITSLGWVPYITVVDMNVQGRGLNISAPW